MNGSTRLTPMEIFSIFVTVTLALLLIILAKLSVSHTWLLWLAASTGALGGLAHEIAQSGGKIAFFQRYQDGFYLGSVAGMVLGAVAGLLVARGLVSGLAGAPVTTTPIQLAYDGFIAGLALKGVTEAAGGNAVK